MPPEIKPFYNNMRCLEIHFQDRCLPDTLLQYVFMALMIRQLYEVGTTKNGRYVSTHAIYHSDNHYGLVFQDVFCILLYFSMRYLQNGGACDHNPDSVHLIMGSPISTNPSLQLYWTVLPTKQCPLSITLPFKGGKGEGQDMALHLGTCPDQTPSDPHSIVSGPTRAQPNGHKNEAWPRKL